MTRQPIKPGLELDHRFWSVPGAIQRTTKRMWRDYLLNGHDDWVIIGGRIHKIHVRSVYADVIDLSIDPRTYHPSDDTFER